jgi:hypothetical protein
MEEQTKALPAEDKARRIYQNSFNMSVQKPQNVASLMPESRHTL